MDDPTPARKSLEKLDSGHARGLERDLSAHLGPPDFVTAAEKRCCWDAGRR